MDLERFTDSRRWPVVVDCLLAAAVLGLQLLSMYFIDGLRDYFTWEVALEVCACAALMLRRRFPVLVLLWILAVALVHDWGLYYASETAFGPNVFAIMVAVYTMATALNTTQAVLLLICNGFPFLDQPAAASARSAA
ncbi:hypothetical protein ABZX92_37945, partial [Lentzea sp. NPDC006480]|uniref:DUF7134 domain-containing protein n=1 Tax=Lentzea sp. NPDC006480 TaxID=3157176 RepID=UPI0033A8FC5F